MDKDTAQAYLPLVQALADGKTLQLDWDYRHEGLSNWRNYIDPDLFEYPPEAWRIKPEVQTVEAWGVLDSSGELQKQGYGIDPITTSDQISVKVTITYDPEAQ